MTDVTTLAFDQSEALTVHLVASVGGQSSIAADEIDFRDQYVVVRFALGEATETWLLPYSNIRAVTQPA